MLRSVSAKKITLTILYTFKLILITLLFCKFYTYLKEQKGFFARFKFYLVGKTSTSNYVIIINYKIDKIVNTFYFDVHIHSCFNDIPH